MTRVGIYARVSHLGDQDPESQLGPLRAFAAANGWDVVREYVDRCSAVDLRGRVEWRQLRADARQRRVDVILVWKLDRAFRSALHALAALGDLQERGVDFVALTQPIDTRSSMGRVMFTMLAAFAEFERDLISERSREGVARARSEGRRLGRPPGARDRRQRRRRRLALAAGAEDLPL